MYSVFYELDGMFPICRTDLPSLEEADRWLSEFLAGNPSAKFYFTLNNGHILVRGESIDISEEFFKDCMEFAYKICSQKI